MHSGSRNVTLKMAGLMTKTCRGKYRNKNISLELGAFCQFLIHIMHINARNMEHITMNNTCGKTVHREMVCRGCTVNDTVSLLGSCGVWKVIIMWCHDSATVVNNRKYMLCHNS